MLSPEQSQIATCLLKFNLEQIEDEFVQQLSVLPELDIEHEENVRETLSILRVVRSLGSESEQLNQENVRLVAKRMQLKRQSEELQGTVEAARAARVDMANALTQMELQMDSEIRKYEDSLREKAERFRNSRGYYNEEEIKVEMEKSEATIKILEENMAEKQHIMEKLKQCLEMLHRAIPDDILDIVGKEEIDNKINSLTAEYEVLQQKQNEFLQD